MKMKKLSILMIAIVALGIFALPATLSIGQGQHKFRQAGSDNTSIPEFCNQCHATGGDAITAELAASDVRSASNALLGYDAAGTRVHSQVGCNDCHAIAGGYGTQQVTAQHAAQLPSCLKCHDGGAEAVGFGNTNNIVTELTNGTEAHKAVYEATQATDDDIMCIGCHTYVVKGGQVTYSFTTGETVYGLTIGNTPTNPAKTVIR